MRIQTVYIYPGISESAQLENAKQKAKNHPHGFSNICYHKQGAKHNQKCYKFDINAKDDEDKAKKVF